MLLMQGRGRNGASFALGMHGDKTTVVEFTMADEARCFSAFTNRGVDSYGNR